MRVAASLVGVAVLVAGIVFLARPTGEEPQAPVETVASPDAQTSVARPLERSDEVLSPSQAPVASHGEDEAAPPEEQAASSPGEVDGPAPTEEARLHGRVIDAFTGTPVAGARVSALASLMREARPSEKTGADGRFEISPIAAEMDLTIRVEHPTYHSVDVRQGRRVEAPTIRLEKGEEREVTFEVEPGARLEGQVLDEDGNAVASADIAVLDADVSDRAIEELGPRDPTVRAESDEEGRFVAAKLLAGTVRVAAIHRDHHVAVSDPLTLRPGEDSSVDLVLSKGVRVFGVVRDASGRPWPGVAVGLGGIARNTRSADDGSYEITGVRSGSHLLAVHAWGDGSADGPELFIHPFEIPKGVSEYRVDLAPSAGGARLFGQVSRDGEPVENVSVTFMADEPGENALRGIRGGRTDELGRYEILNAPPGPARLFSSSDGEATSSTTVERLTVPNATEHRHDIELPSADVRGRVVGEGLEAVEGRVELRHQREEVPRSLLDIFTGPFSHRSTELEPDGSFVIENIQPGTYRPFVMVTSDIMRERLTRQRMFSPVTIATDDLDLGRLEMGPSTIGGLLVIEVTGSNGRSVPKPHATLWQNGELVSFRSTWSDEDELLVSAAPGEYRVEVTASGHAPVVLDEVVLRSGEQTKRRVQMRPGASLEVTVTERGQPVPGAELWIRDESGRLPYRNPETAGEILKRGGFRTNEAGRYTFVDLSLGRYTISVRHPTGFPDRTITLTRGEQQELELIWDG